MHRASLRAGWKHFQNYQQLIIMQTVPIINGRYFRFHAKERRIISACYRLGGHQQQFELVMSPGLLSVKITLPQSETKTSGLWVCERVLFLLFSAFLEPAHVLPVWMINLFPLIIYVIQNVIYVSMNFELWPKPWIVNLSSQTLSEYTLLDSLVWSTHKSLQTGAEVHALSFLLSSALPHTSWRFPIGQNKRGEVGWLLQRQIWRIQNRIKEIILIACH